ncbi:MAG: hypothetical protein AAF612_11580, partial [Planctomycetota bacterium]
MPHGPMHLLFGSVAVFGLAVSDAPLLAQTAPTEAPATQPSAASPTADAEAPPATQPSPEASAEA